MKVFLDTNVIIDFYAQRHDFFHASAVIIDLAVKGKIDIVVSGTTFVNAFYLLKDYYDAEELYNAMSRLADKCKISTIDSEIVQKALAMHSNDFEDAVQLLSAQKANADVIVTRDKHFKSFSGNILSPLDFLDRHFSHAIT